MRVAFFGSKSWSPEHSLFGDHSRQCGGAMAADENGDTLNWGRKGRRTRRQEGRDFVKLYQQHPELFKKPSKYRTELFVTLASLCLPLGWAEIMSDHSLWRVWLGWVLWAVPVCLLLHICYRWLSDLQWTISGRWTLVLLGLFIFVAIAGVNIHLSSKPAFLFVVPGLITADNSTRIYYVLTKGRYPFFAVDFRFADEDRMTAQPVSSHTLYAHWEEIDPRNGGFPVSVAAHPFNPGHERFTASFQSRDVDVFETLKVETSGFALFPRYYVKVTNQRTGKVIVECKSQGFPT